jgi:hypothetical protein
MTMKSCFLFLLALGTTVSCATADPTADPLLSPSIVLCLRPLRMAEQPAVTDAVESVKRLKSFAEKQEGMARRAVDALVFIFSDLFQREAELTAAKSALAQAERQALAKEQLAARAETVGSGLSGPNPRLAVIYRKEAADILGKARQRHEAALNKLKEKITAYNLSVGYFQTQGDTEVVIALASSLFAVVDRHLPGFDFNPTVSREWIEKQKRVEA